MSKLLLFIGENVRFDEAAAVAAIESIAGVRNARRGKFIGAIFECEYGENGESTIVRISEDRETITVEGVDDLSLGFALKLKSALNCPLSVVDLDYSFHIDLAEVRSLKEFRDRIAAAS